MATIKAIEGRSVHQIQSGQVIVDLTSVVKELIENSLDAGASKIDVRFKNYGIDSIEVQDDGNGIAPEDFPSVALKHHTSKLSNFEDLDTLKTFGFRGEALSSLCALAKVHIITARAQDGAVGKRLDFEISGKLKGTSIIAAQKGTTVVAENIFYGLPVRLKELEKHCKREWTKVLSFMYSYACIGVHIRFSVSNQPSKGKKITAFSTKGNATVRENIANVFGAKTISHLIKLDLTLQMAPTGLRAIQASQHPETSQARQIYVEGHVSRPTWGEGRQTPDRQMFFVNSRPCLLPQIAKVFNEVYKSFNHNQSPFVLANLRMETDTYDVNVSPDKKTIMLHDQTTLLESLKTSLTDLFQSTDHTVPQSQLPTQKLPSYKPLTVPCDASSETVDIPDTTESERINHSSISRRHPITDQIADDPDTNLIGDWAGRDSTVRRERNTSKTSKSDVLQRERVLDGPQFQGVSVFPPVDAMDVNEDGRASDGGSTYRAGRLENTPSSHETAVELVTENQAAKTYDDVFSRSPPRTATTRKSAMSSSQALLPRSTQRSVVGARGVYGAASQETIPSTFNSAPKVSAGPINDAFSRMRPRRVSAETTDITIGDSTTRTVVGSAWSNKKRRIYTPRGAISLQGSSDSSAHSQDLRAFAAPGSQLALDNEVSYADTHSEHSDSEVDDDMLLDGTPIMSTSAKSIADDSGASHDPVQGQSQEMHKHTSMDDEDPDQPDETEEEKRRREDDLVAQLIQAAETPSSTHRVGNATQSALLNENTSKRKDLTFDLSCSMQCSMDAIERFATSTIQHLTTSAAKASHVKPDAEHEDVDAEAKLSLTVNKTDFHKMLIVGQFNLGFILAVRLAEDDAARDELFIIDQHAADEKFNFEHLQSTVVLQSQPLVQPKLLELTAVEEEVVAAHPDALKANGFEIDIREDEDSMSSRSYRLLTLPTSHNKTFKLADLEELMHLLSELSVESREVPRPKKVRQMLAMRACRSSIMVGKTLTAKQMVKVVRNMGNMEKPWNCPHGRPTMRHLTSLDDWQGWYEGSPIDEDSATSPHEACTTPWKRWLQNVA